MVGGEWGGSGMYGGCAGGLVGWGLRRHENCGVTWFIKGGCYGMREGLVGGRKGWGAVCNAMGM